MATIIPIPASALYVSGIVPPSPLVPVARPPILARNMRQIISGIDPSIGVMGRVKRRAGAAPVILPLDLVSGAAAAYSFRKLRLAYAGSAAQVQRSSDNTTQDVGFSGNDFNASAFSAFIGAGTGAVAKWYDQGTNANDAVQATAANQPAVVSAGAPVYTAQATGSSGQRLVASDAASIQNIWSGGGFIALVTKPTRGGSGNGAWLSKGSGPNGWVIYTHQTTDHQIILYVRAATTDAVYWTNETVSATQPSVITFAWNSSTPATPGTITLNGVPCTYNLQQTPVGAISSDVGSPAVVDNDFLLGTGASALDGNIYEMLLYKGIPSAGNQTSLVNNMRVYFGTP